MYIMIRFMEKRKQNYKNMNQTVKGSAIMVKGRGGGGEDHEGLSPCTMCASLILQFYTKALLLRKLKK